LIASISVGLRGGCEFIRRRLYSKGNLWRCLISPITSYSTVFSGLSSACAFPSGLCNQDWTTARAFNVAPCSAARTLRDAPALTIDAGQYKFEARLSVVRSATPDLSSRLGLIFGYLKSCKPCALPIAGRASGAACGGPMWQGVGAAVCTSVGEQK
jgi:hypothetical protein